MDKRVIKTKKAIRQAFISLRQDKPIEKIYVENLCREALINKSTFYRYYRDIYDLVEQLQEEALAPIRQFLLENPIQEENISMIIDDLEETISQVYRENKGLFSNQDETLEKIFQLYQETISKNVSEMARLRLSFAVGGAYAILKHQHYRLTKEQKEVLYDLFKRIFAD